MMNSTRVSSVFLFGLILTFLGTASVKAQWVGPDGVLVVYNTAWPDDDGNGISDSQDVAEYYAARRGIPSQNLLAVSTSTSYTYQYADFYNEVLTPVVAKLDSYDGPTQFRDKIYYIVTCYGIPVRVTTNFTNDENPLLAGYGNSARCLDAWLMQAHFNAAGSYDGDGKPIDSGGNLLGDNSSEVYNAYSYSITTSTDPDTIAARTFKGRRDDGYASLLDTYLVCRLDGLNMEVAKGLVDKALYAESYLRYHASATHPHYISHLSDAESGTGSGHSAHAAYYSQYAQGGYPNSPWNPANSGEAWYLGSSFDLDGDNQSEEVGEGGHLPRVTGTISAIDGNTLTISEDRAAYLFPIGKTVTSSGGGSAAVTAINGSAKQITVDNVTDFNVSNTVTWEWSGAFPIKPMFAYTFYAYGAYQDVFAFPVGAVGKHMDSGSAVNIRSESGYWAAKALIRNVTSTQGAVSEPMNTGENYFDLTMISFALGCDAANSWYNGMSYVNRWMGLMVTDPLYAPLRDFDAHIDDAVDPVISAIRTVNSSATGRTFEIDLGGTGEAALDVCQFKVEYGLTASYGSVYDYSDFSGTLDGSWSSTRRYFFTRRCTAVITGLTNAQLYHYRVSAIDPYGNETVTGDYTFTVGGADTSETPSGTTNQSPVAVISAASVNVAVGEDPGFDGSASSDPDGSITLYEWDFQYVGPTFTVDAVGAAPAHTYSTAGSYTAALRVTDNDGATDLDTAVIDVAPAPIITVTSPNGGEAYTGGQTVLITWTSSGFTGNVRIEFYNGSAWSDIIASTANDGSHNWTIPNENRTGCLVRVSDAADNDPYDESNGTFTLTQLVDTDSDGMDDTWENTNFGNLSHDGTADGDSDGLTDLEEFQNGTDPGNSDSDSDGMPDGWEVDNGFDPTDSGDGAGDADSDGLSNAEEYANGTDPGDADSDNDGMTDGWEVDNGLNPVSDTDAAADSDSDGLTNLQEFTAGTDPFDSDTDNDGLLDGEDPQPLIPSSIVTGEKSEGCTAGTGPGLTAWLLVLAVLMQRRRPVLRNGIKNRFPGVKRLD